MTPGPTAICIETAIGCWTRPGSDLPGIGAGAAPEIVVIAAGDGGHGCGWLGARRVVRALVHAYRRADAECNGAASDVLPAEALKRWMGDRALKEPSLHLPPDLGDALAALEPLLKIPVSADHELQLMVECIAARFEGPRVHGAHAGCGRAIRIRAEADRPEPLVIPHYWDRMAARMDGYRDIDPALLPPNTVVNALGMLTACAIGVDRFELTLGAGDILLLSSRAIDLGDAALVRLIRAKAAEPVAMLARAIETAMLEARGDTGSDIAFAVARARTTEP